jgi:Tfp pilus assembly protein PilN
MKSELHKICVKTHSNVSAEHKLDRVGHSAHRLMTTLSCAESTAVTLPAWGCPEELLVLLLLLLLVVVLAVLLVLLVLVPSASDIAIERKVNLYRKANTASLSKLEEDLSMSDCHTLSM